ncbi:TBC1 domain family member 12-like [Myripristis murdjan]|uniref:TBC1 domain family member 12-like n=1 Tax=Myripristis murdjan TaxID=586833 RepID=A0A667ZX41_9TELE|nr:TBC1 domain family member 12-like [Myripristis murdjan]
MEASSDGCFPSVTISSTEQSSSSPPPPSSSSSGSGGVASRPRPPCRCVCSGGAGGAEGVTAAVCAGIRTGSPDTGGSCCGRVSGSCDVTHVSEGSEVGGRAAPLPNGRPPSSSSLDETDTAGRSSQSQPEASASPAHITQGPNREEEEGHSRCPSPPPKPLPSSVSCDSAPLDPGDEASDEPQRGERRFPEACLGSRNTFKCSRQQSAPGQPPQGGAGGGAPEAEPDLETTLQSRRPGIVEYLGRGVFSRKQSSGSPSVAGFKLFGKVPPRESPAKTARTIQQEYEARHSMMAAGSSPTHHASGRSRKNLEFEPLSTTALILEDRPANLPAKSEAEAQRHRQQYDEMVAGAKRRELREAQRRQSRRQERFRQEESIASAMLVWNNHILPHWDAMRSSRRARDLWWQGLPPNVRGRVWSLAVGNELNITAELYHIFLSRAKERWRNRAEDQADDGESSLQLITLDISRTFPSLCVFQKGGPYHDLLQSILGAYACYRPDVGYVQGMSFIAAVLILNMDEVDAFVCFSNLINKPCQMAFFRVDHQLMLRYFGAFEVFFEESLPRLFLHFQSFSLTPDLYLIDWIFSLYTKPLPLDVACRVWDVFCRDGEEFLFRTGLGILRLHQDVLLHMDFIHIAQFLSRLPDEELLSDRLFACIAATPMLSGNRKWSQVLSSVTKEAEKS